MTITEKLAELRTVTKDMTFELQMFIDGRWYIRVKMIILRSQYVETCSDDMESDAQVVEKIQEMHDKLVQKIIHDLRREANGMAEDIADRQRDISNKRLEVGRLLDWSESRGVRVEEVEDNEDH